MTLLVQKYGGSSVATPEKLRLVARQVQRARQAGHQLVVVVSAMGDTTDNLLALSRQVTGQPPSAREMDMLLSTGEQVSIALLAMALHDLGEDAVSLTGPQVGIQTDSVHRKARVLSVRTERLRRELDAGRIVIVAGFQGLDGNGDITTLGRGGSDTTAVALAAALGADRCEIYTDVEGIFTADPRLVPDARRLDEVSYDEMLELASLGAQVMQLRSVEYAMQHGVTIHVRKSLADGPGTVIKEAGNMGHKRAVIGVAHDPQTAKVTIADVPDEPGTAHAIFAALAEAAINVDLIIQSASRNSHTDISFTISSEDLPQAQAVLADVIRDIGASGLTADDNVAKISVVGSGMISQPGVAASMFGCLSREGINIQMIGCSEIKLSCVIARDQVAQAAQALHREFKLDELDG